MQGTDTYKNTKTHPFPFMGRSNSRILGSANGCRRCVGVVSASCIRPQFNQRPFGLNMRTHGPLAACPCCLCWKLSRLAFWCAGVATSSLLPQKTLTSRSQNKTEQKQGTKGLLPRAGRGTSPSITRTHYPPIRRDNTSYGMHTRYFPLCACCLLLPRSPAFCLSSLRTQSCGRCRRRQGRQDTPRRFP